MPGSSGGSLLEYDMITRPKRNDKEKKTHLSSESGSSSPIISSSKTFPLSATGFPIAFEAILLRAFSRSESRYSCDTSSSSSSEVSSSDSDSEEEERDEDGLADVDDGEGELEDLAYFADS